jgi:hypothetical protein
MLSSDGVKRRGTELDWLGFFFALNATTSAPWSLSDIGDLYEEMATSTSTPTWSDMRDSALVLTGALNDPQFVALLTEADRFGVDDP